MALTPPGRFPLAVLPTPLVRARRLEQALGSGAIYLKRDDLTGFALAGNKARKLEYLLADARRQDCDLLVTGGGPGSNFCAAAAAAARVAGLECRLILYGDEPQLPHPNLAMMRWFGAGVRFTGDPDRSSVDRALSDLAGELKARDRRPYTVPRGGASGTGALGYAVAAGELARQLETLRVAAPVVVLATGSGGTQAGLLAAGAADRNGWRLVGASVSRPVDECRRRVLEISRECAGLMGTTPPGETAVEVVDARGPGFGLPSAAGAAAADLAARTEGLILDPVYTAKGFAALVDLVAAGPQRPTVFIHTGGAPAALKELTSNYGKEPDIA